MASWSRGLIATHDVNMPAVRFQRNVEDESRRWYVFGPKKAVFRKPRQMFDGMLAQRVNWQKY
jgi:hypothetical protein